MSFGQQAIDRSTLSEVNISNLRQLMISWDTLADLYLGDLLLYAPLSGQEEKFICVGHVRPIQTDTLYQSDPVGEVKEWSIFSEALASGEVERLEHSFSSRQVETLVIPLKSFGYASSLLVAQRALEAKGFVDQDVYLDLAKKFFQMIESGDFPYPSSLDVKGGPRVPDGVMVLDKKGIVSHVSPNARSAFNRFGFKDEIIGTSLDKLGFDRQTVVSSLRKAEPNVDEIHMGMVYTISIIIMPIINAGITTEALVVVRGAPDFRKNDRLAVAMDTTIRETHHRVKNNLQKVSSLLHLQSRRLKNKDAKDAIADSVRRIASIAVVHEMLSRRGIEEVALNDIIRPLVTLTKSTLVNPEVPVTFEINGEGPTLPENIVSSIAIVVAELLQNALDHGFPLGSEGGKIVINIRQLDSELVIEVIDNGVGLPESFDVEDSLGLGLTMARTLAVGDCRGELQIEQVESGGTKARLVTYTKTADGAPIEKLFEQGSSDS